MNRRERISRWISTALAAAAAIVLAISLLTGSRRANLEGAAEDLGRDIERRATMLDSYIQEALKKKPENWKGLRKLPEDMVVYRFRADTLQGWANQFPIHSEDLRPRTLIQRLGDSRDNLTSPLANVSEQFSFMNMGPKWFLVKAVEGEDCKVIAGLEIVNELQAGSINGANRHFHLDTRYTIRPISTSVGEPVVIGGVPLMKLTAETMSEPHQPLSALTWLAVALLLSASLMVLRTRPNRLWLIIVLTVQLALLGWLYFYGHRLTQVSQFFSPLLYADGQILYSLGSLVLLNLALTLVVVDFYLVRKTILKSFLHRKRWLQWVASVLIALTFAAVCVHIHYTFRSVQYNSNITLELYKVVLLSQETALVYLSFLSLSLTLPLLLQMLAPLVKNLFGIRYDAFSLPGRILYAFAVGAYFVTASATMGFLKEQQRVDVWSNRLAMDRDIGLEIQLRAAEGAIADDPMMGALSVLDGSEDLLRNRLVGNFMGRISQDYDIAVFRAGGNNISTTYLLMERVRDGKELGEGSHFFYNSLGSGRVSYTGIFTYYDRLYGANTILISVESKHNREDRGYLSLLGIADPGRVSLPPVYSWAKYVDRRLVQYKGAYPYPTILEGALQQSGHAEEDGWTHFVNQVSEEEVVVLSRPATEPLYLVVEGILFAIVSFLAMSVLGWRRKRTGGRRYYQTRIGLVVYISLILTLVAMAVFSVWFVYRRNNADMESIMTARINTLQSMLQEHLRMVEAPEDLTQADVRSAVETVGNNLKCDISLFDISGKLLMSTTPEVYDRMILGHLLDDNAYNSIIYSHKRFCIQPERVGRRRYYALCAPLMNSEGRMVAIASSPFSDFTADLETEAALHVAIIIVIFLLLLLISRFVTFEVVRRMFQPLQELRRKMTVSEVSSLEPLQYTQDDEITPLVEAYNRMVQSLGESSLRLAQAERDKAWTDMARRVAHDLKNPLTPIKLQLQMLMRMKAADNPAWKERFDEVADTILYHVDLLADSADQFSTFAKLYDQQSERLDLDALVQQEVALFDAREDVQVDYFGLSDAWVSAPRPQLMRVVVNLLTNAIQAMEGQEGEKRLVVAVRNAVEDGFYDIVVEDNGPGVAEDQQEQIFTPDFTTKSSGSGLGLAICRRIVEHCGGSISYSRSFTLGGACFTVKYPKA
ncbi:MAG: GHKL domain-containing protein [Bacteroidales bacterium]|nr:GHKL domain-containing protein [Bacteroidales bacterium]